MDIFFFDYVIVFCNLFIFKGKFIIRDVIFRKLKLIDFEVFMDDLCVLEFLLDLFILLIDLVRLYNIMLLFLLDEYVFFCIRVIVLCFSVFWFNEEI